MGMLDGKRILVTGVLTDASLAFAVAAWPRKKGPRWSSAAPAAACRSPGARPASCRDPVDVLEIDVAQPEQLAAAAAELGASGTGWTACSTPSASPRRNAWAADMFEADWDRCRLPSRSLPTR